MSRSRLPVFIVISLASAAGCGRAHLGPRFGDRYRAAFEAQAESRQSEEPGPLDAHDAKGILARHRGVKGAGGGGADGGGGAPAVGLVIGGGGGGSEGGYGADGNPNPIKLEAK